MSVPGSVRDGLRDILALHSVDELELLVEMVMGREEVSAAQEGSSDASETHDRRNVLLSRIVASPLVQSQEGVERLLARMLESVVHEYLRQQGLPLLDLAPQRPLSRVLVEYWTKGARLTNEGRAYKRLVSALPQYRRLQAEEMRKAQRAQALRNAHGAPVGDDRPPFMQSLPPLSWAPVAASHGGTAGTALAVQVSSVEPGAAARAARAPGARRGKG